MNENIYVQGTTVNFIVGFLGINYSMKSFKLLSMVIKYIDVSCSYLGRHWYSKQSEYKVNWLILVYLL